MDKTELLNNLKLNLQSYLNTSSINKIVRAYEFAEIAHMDQLRLSGEPYIIHPLHVAIELSILKLDESSITASLLHDTVEDTTVELDFVEKEFGKEVAELVNGVTKISGITKTAKKSEEDFEPVRRFLIAAAKDIRVVIIKLADRLHNMQTIQYLPLEKQFNYAKETERIYVPLAEYIGISVFKTKLEDLAFAIIEPQAYEMIVKELNEDAEERNKYLSEVIKELQRILNKEKIKGDIFGRSKSIASIYNKVIRREGRFELPAIRNLNDLTAVSIVVDQVVDCYRVLGLVHHLWRHLPDEFDDYIANPKPNGFRSIQTSVRAIQNRVVEIQIKTHTMHDYNEFGPASHISYKRQGKYFAKGSAEFSWVKNLSSWKQASKAHDKFSVNVFEDSIFVLTPKGAVKELQVGATPIDFAYKIHTQLGDSCRGVRVNNKLVPLDTKLQNGDIVEIIVQKNAKYPRRDWLNFAITSYARESIRKGIRAQEIKENVISDSKEEKKSVNNLKIVIEAADRIGLLEDVSGVLSKYSVNIDNSQTSTKNGIARLHFDMEMRYKHEIDDLISAIRKIRSVISVKKLT